MLRRLPYSEWVQGCDQDHQLYVSIERVARMLGVSRSTIYRMLRDGRMPSPVGRCGTRLRFSRQEIIDWAQAGLPDAARWADLRRCVGAAARPMR